MRVLLSCLIVLMLVSCAQPTPGSAGPGAPTAETLDGPAAAAHPPASAPVMAQAPRAPMPPELARQQRDCAEIGGQMLRLGSRLVCQRPTRDAGMVCRQASDCEAGCLARAGVCAPVTPLFGCHDLAMAAGRIERVCRD